MLKFTPSHSSFRILLTLALFFRCFHEAAAFCYAPQLAVSDEYFLSDLVVSATVMSKMDVIPPADPDGVDGTFYRLRLDRTFRGKARSRIRTYSENSAARFPLRIHQKYLLFLHKDNEHPGIFWVDNCGNSQEVQKASKQLRELRSIPISRSYVYGEIVPYQGVDTSCSHVEISMTGPTSQKVKVANNCTFRADLPPGVYRAEATIGLEHLTSYDLPYKNPHCFRIPEGGSAGIAFRVLDRSVGKETIRRNEVDDKALQALCEAELHPTPDNLKVRTECLMNEGWMSPCNPVNRRREQKAELQ